MRPSRRSGFCKRITAIRRASSLATASRARRRSPFHHWSYALDSIIRFRHFRGELSAGQAREAFGFIDGMPVTVRHVPRIQTRAREIAAQANQRRVYDSVYAAHAEVEGCALWTADHSYFRAVRGLLSHGRYLGDL